MLINPCNILVFTWCRVLNPGKYNKFGVDAPFSDYLHPFLVHSIEGALGEKEPLLLMGNKMRSRWPKTWLNPVWVFSTVKDFDFEDIFSSAECCTMFCALPHLCHVANGRNLLDDITSDSVEHSLENKHHQHKHQWFIGTIMPSKFRWQKKLSEH